MSENDRIMSIIHRRPHSVVFLLLPKVHMLDLSGPLQAFYEAINLCNCPIEMVYTSFEENSLNSEQQLGLFPKAAPDTIDISEDTLICIPGFDFNSFKNGSLSNCLPAAIRWLNEAYRQRAQLASICTGALLLGEAGLLNGRRCTCHWKCLDYLKAKYPAAKVQAESIYTEDGRIYTSAGMSTGIDLALYLLEQWFGAFVAARVAQEMVVPFRREGNASQENLYNQMQGGFHPAVFKAQELLLNHPEANPGLDQLAAQVHVSSRHLSRLFKKYTGKTIHEFRKQVRLELARQLLSQGQLTVDEVARRCGYTTARQFRRVWKEWKGSSPTDRNAQH